MPNKAEMKAFQMNKQRGEKKLLTIMTDYKQRHNKITEKQGKTVHYRLDTNQARKIPNNKYLIKCVNNMEISSIESISRYIQKRTIKKEKSGKKCAANMTNEMKYISNKIRKVIEKMGKFLQKSKKKGYYINIKYQFQKQNIQVYKLIYLNPFSNKILPQAIFKEKEELFQNNLTF
ncbi:unnamed protein product [Paramecium sonneborni]|uniref:Uncharacterized protein n=1 Tax=Paramecium sonneborni TaxID=65129 RepID=A0A8S1MFX3_9CILI|nr:unnamed protein product [Paramecium sonneborni]